MARAEAGRKLGNCNALAADDRSNQAPGRIDGDQIGGAAHLNRSDPLRKPRHRGWICREQTQAVFDRSAREPDEVGKCAVERQHAAGKNAIGHRSPVLYLHRKTTKRVLAVGHARSAHGVCHKNSALRALGATP